MATTKKAGKIRMKVTLLIMVIVVVMVSLGFAWYSFHTKHADTNTMKIMTPYTLYLLDATATDSLELSVGGIHPGESKQIIVCVSSHDAGQTTAAREGEFPYTLELVHTENIGLEYELYELEAMGTETPVSMGAVVTFDYEEKVEDGNGNFETIAKTAYFKKKSAEALSESSDSVDLTEKYRKEMYGNEYASQNIVNTGVYRVYKSGYDQNEFKLSLDHEEEWYDYFLIEITWNAENEQENTKETDLVYLVAKAGVPQPMETTVP